ncbi:MAG: Tungsten-containing formylmethanofuran dehydrogenase 2 subunit G [Methanoregula sp. PtaU1.Bin051]|nr:MAG: Tungsten-containing formylmethanofuran dehydrogenase 2 subunit G [Methanoregula sp. PtaU1.Bin051]
MAASIIWYLREFFRPGWLKKFLFAKTAPLTTPPYFRDFPEPTGKPCQHALFCMMVCPAPGAIDVVMEEDGWRPRIHKGHCIRCGLCVEACPNGVLRSGRILETRKAEGTAFIVTFRISIDPDLCTGCGNCATSCPVNKQLDPQIGAGGHSSNDEVIMRVLDGDVHVLHEEKCTGCKTCEVSCPTRAIQIARILEGTQQPQKGGGQ